jgi:ketosteroid isomerase-like protein
MGRPKPTSSVPPPLTAASRPLTRLIPELMTLSIRLAVIAAVAAASVAVVQSGRSPSREAAAVRAARTAQNSAIAAHDLDRAASYWTDDVVIRSALGRVIQGSATYRATLGADSATVYHRKSDHVDVSDNERWPLAFESGTWTGSDPRDGKPLIRGRYAAQWIKRDGRWLIRSEVFVALGCAGTGCSRPLAVP